MKTLYIAIGVSGSGKSTFAERLAKHLNIPRISSDEIRGELCNGDQTDQSKNGLVFKIFHERLEKVLETGSVVADATNVKQHDRNVLRKFAIKHGAHIIAIVMNLTKEECHTNNKNRDRVVPDFVIEKQWANFEQYNPSEFTERITVNWTRGGVTHSYNNMADSMSVEQFFESYGKS